MLETDVPDFQMASACFPPDMKLLVDTVAIAPPSLFPVDAISENRSKPREERPTTSIQLLNFHISILPVPIFNSCWCLVGFFF